MLDRNNEIFYLNNLIDQLETLEVMYDGMVSKNIIDLLKKVKDQAEMELRKKDDE